MKRVFTVDNESDNIENLDYKNLQKKCKEYKLKAVGDKTSLQTRLSDYFKSLQLSNTATTLSVNKNEEVDTIIDQLDDLNIDDIKYERVDPTETTYTTDEIKPILQLGILVSNSLKERLNSKTSSKNKPELSVSLIIKTFEKESESVPECKIKTRRKVILINAIITLFEDEIKGKTQKDALTTLDELIEGGKETVKKHIQSLKSKKRSN